MKFGVWPYGVILAAHQHHIIIIVIAKNFFHSGDIALGDAIASPYYVLPLFNKFNVREIGDILKGSLVNILVDMDVYVAVWTVQNFSQSINLFRILIG